MLQRTLLLGLVGVLSLLPAFAWAAFETIEAVQLSPGWLSECNCTIDVTYLYAERPAGVGVNASNGHLWFGAFSVLCCDWYYWYGDIGDWVVVDFPPFWERWGWCGPCKVPCEFPDPTDRCDDPGYALSHFLSHTYTEFRRPGAIAVDPRDGSVWVAEPGQILHLDRWGDVIWYGIDYVNPRSISVNTTDGSCWVANTDNHEVVRISSGGSVLWRIGGFNLPTSISVNSADGTAWVADNANAQVVHLAADGSELWRGGDLVYPLAVSVNSADGSCWVADKHADAVVHLDSEGTELHRVSLTTPRALAVNPKHGDCWVISGSQVVHLDPDGTMRAGTIGPSGEGQLAVSLPDDTVWVSDEDGGTVIQLAPVCSPFSDIGCWHWALHEIVACYDADLVRGYQEVGEYTTYYAYHPGYIVTRDQMAVYIARALAGGDAFVPEGDYSPTFTDVWYSYWAYKYIEYAHDQNVVKGYGDGSYNPYEAVNRAQMAVYVARSLEAPTGEAALADYVPADPRNFPDVPNTGYGDDGTEPFWAYKHVEYCVENGVVQGYVDGHYHPDVPVTRDQMAVYIRRAFKLPIS